MPARNTIEVQIVGSNNSGPALNQLNQQLDTTKTKATGLGGAIGSALSNIGTIAGGVLLGNLATQMAGGLTGVIEKSVSLGKETLALQRVIGGTTEEVSGLLAVFGRYGVEQEAASRMLGMFSRRMQGLEDMTEVAIQGGKGFSGVMKDLGINFLTSEGHARPLYEVIMDVADAFKGMPNGVDKSAAALQIFGRSGLALLPVLNLGREGIIEVMEAARKYGLVLTSENVDAVRQYSLAQKDMNMAITGFTVQAGLVALPILAQLARAGAGAAQVLNTSLMPVIKEGAQWLGQLASWGGEAAGVLGGELSNALGELKSRVTGSLDFSEAAAAAWKWGSNIADQFAAGIIDGATLFILQAVNFIGNLLAEWLAPGSPPKVAHEMDKWGAGAMESYLSGFSQADFSILETIDGKMKSVLQGLVTYGELGQTQLIPTLLGTRSDLAEAIRMVEQTGNVTSDMLDRISGRFGSASDYVRSYIQAQLALLPVQQALAAETERLEAAQRSLDTLTRRDRTADRQDRVAQLQLEKRLMEAQMMPFDKPVKDARGNLMKGPRQRAIEEIQHMQETQRARQRYAQIDRELSTDRAKAVVEAEQDRINDLRNQEKDAKKQLDIQSGILSALTENASLHKEQQDAVAKGAGAVGSAIEKTGEVTKLALEKGFKPLSELMGNLQKSFPQTATALDNLSHVLNSLGAGLPIVAGGIIGTLLFGPGGGTAIGATIGLFANTIMKEIGKRISPEELKRFLAEQQAWVSAIAYHISNGDWKEVGNLLKLKIDEAWSGLQEWTGKAWSKIKWNEVWANATTFASDATKWLQTQLDKIPWQEAWGNSGGKLLEGLASALSAATKPTTTLDEYGERIAVPALAERWGEAFGTVIHDALMFAFQQVKNLAEMVGQAFGLVPKGDWATAGEKAGADASIFATKFIGAMIKNADIMGAIRDNFTVNVGGKEGTIVGAPQSTGTNLPIGEAAAGVGITALALRTFPWLKDLAGGALGKGGDLLGLINRFGGVTSPAGPGGWTAGAGVGEGAARVLPSTFENFFGALGRFAPLLAKISPFLTMLTIPSEGMPEEYKEKYWKGYGAVPKGGQQNTMYPGYGEKTEAQGIENPLTTIKNNWPSGSLVGQILGAIGGYLERVNADQAAKALTTQYRQVPGETVNPRTFLPGYEDLGVPKSRYQDKMYWQNANPEPEQNAGPPDMRMPKAGAGPALTSPFLDRIGETIGAFFERIGDKQANKDMLDNWGQSIEDYWGQTLEPWFRNLPQDIGNTINGNVAPLKESGDKAITSLYSGLTENWETVKAGMTLYFNQIPSLLPDLKPNGQDIIRDLQSGVDAQWPTLQARLQAIMANVRATTRTPVEPPQEGGDYQRIPSYANGAFVPTPTVALVGDAPGGEWVIPKRNVLNGSGGGPYVGAIATTVNLTPDLEDIRRQVVAMAEQAVDDAMAKAGFRGSAITIGAYIPS